ncbi:MAG: hypothetical protein NVV59_13560 [Chitinophagaceae bacterium]|nr:hypothetical protein [Chitinophagaceae bacterium]
MHPYEKIFLAAAISIAGLTASARQQAVVQVDLFAKTHTISRHIYGHFSEHLGRCIYDGFWVSDTSSLPKKIVFVST